MPTWILIAIALMLFLLGVKAVLRLGFRRYIARMHADFLSYMGARSPHLNLIDRSSSIEIRVRSVKTASVVWRVLHKRLSELPKEMPGRRMIAFEKFALIIENLAAGPGFDPEANRQSPLPRLVPPPFVQQAGESGKHTSSEPFQTTGDGIIVMKV